MALETKLHHFTLQWNYKVNAECNEYRVRYYSTDTDCREKATSKMYLSTDQVNINQVEIGAQVSG